MGITRNPHKNLWNEYEKNWNEPYANWGIKSKSRYIVTSTILWNAILRNDQGKWKITWACLHSTQIRCKSKSDLAKY